MHQFSSLRPISLAIVLLVIPLFCQSQISRTSDTKKTVQQFEGEKDTAKIDLLLQISGEMLNTQPDESFGYAQDALKLSEELNDARYTGMSYRSLANVYRVTAVYNKALEYALKALVEFESVGDTLWAARCYEDIGIVQMLSENFSEANQSFKKAFRLNRLIHCPAQISSNYMNMGLNYIAADSIDEGLSHLMVSLLIADSLHMEQQKIALMENIGYAYSKLGRHEDALAHFYKVLELTGDSNDDLTRSEAQVNIAKGYLMMKNYPAALRYAQLSFALSGKKHFEHVYRDAAKVLSEAYAGQGDYKKAYELGKKYRDISDTIMNAEKAEQLARIHTIYEVNQKETENMNLREQVLQNEKRSRTRSIVIIVIATLAFFSLVALYLLNKMNNKQIIMNNKLAMQSRELATLNDLKDKFFSFVAHNLKNPFNTIMGFSELMHRAADAKDFKKVDNYAALIHDLAQQVQKVLSNLLEWSRLQRRTFEVKPETVELTGLIRDVVEMNNKEAARKDISLRITSTESIFVVVDRTMITAVLQNLVTNAIHYTPPSGSITIDSVVKDQFTEVTITDTGIGMTQEQLAMLFDFNFSQQRVTSSDQGGAGLGLIICHEMLLKNGGNIFAMSEPGKGSSFIFTLPVAVRHEHPDEPIPQDTPGDAAELLLSSPIPENDAFMDEMKSIIIPKFEGVSKVMSLEDLDAFSKMLIKTGERYEYAALAGYGKSLHSLTTGHQIDVIIRILPKFREYLKKVLQ